jgi:hypothetical protein
MRQAEARDERKQERLQNTVATSLAQSVNSHMDKVVRSTIVPSKSP